MIMGCYLYLWRGSFN